MTKQPLSKLKNIGKTVTLRLQEIGIINEMDLKKMGSAKIYQVLSQKNADQHLPVCYYLYSLEGAIQSKDWRDFSEQEKTDLRIAAGLSK